MPKDYVEKRGEGYYVIGKRVTLDSIVYTYLNGLSPESIVESFPAVTLEEVSVPLLITWLTAPK